MRYTALYSGVTDDPAFAGMSMAGQLCWFFLLSCKHGNMLGLFQLPTMYAACDWRWTVEQVEAGLAEVERSGLICRDGDMIWIVNYLKYNPLRGGNRDSGGATVARNIPDCIFKEPLAVIAEDMGFTETAIALRQRSITYKTNTNRTPFEHCPNTVRTPSEQCPKSDTDTGTCTDTGTNTCAIEIETTNELALYESTVPVRSNGRKQYPSDFEAFWIAYPNKTGKDAAYRAWRTQQRNLPDIDTLVTIVQANRTSNARWLAGYIPNPATWLNQGRWQDALTIERPPDPLKQALAEGR